MLSRSEYGGLADAEVIANSMTGFRVRERRCAPCARLQRLVRYNAILSISNSDDYSGI